MTWRADAPPSPPVAGGEAGFTLIEVVIVLAILGLVGGLVLSRGPGRSAGLDMRLASNAVSGALRSARAEAIARNAPVSVVFDTGASSLRVGGRPTRSLPPGVALDVTGAGDQVAGARAAIRFLPDGSSTGGRVELSARGQRTQVGVDWLTGRVAVADGP